MLLFAGDLKADYVNGPGWDGYRDWLAELPMPVVGIAGNHDHDVSEQFRALPWIYLENELYDLDGLRIWGSPHCRAWGAFGLPEPELALVWKAIPSDIDVLITHAPPYGLCDLAQGREHIGSPSLTERLVHGEFPRLKLVCCGHVHEGYGVDELIIEGPQLGSDNRMVKVVNGSYVDDRFAPGNPPIVIDL